MLEIDIISSILVLFSSPWVWLILIASVMYAAGNYIDELLLSEYEQEVGTMVIISTLFGLVVATFFATYAYLKGIELSLPLILLCSALLVGVLEALWVIPYLYATERSGAIIAGPLFQAVPIFALFLESFFGVIPPLMQIIGAGIIVLGGIIISIEKEESEAGTRRKVDWTTIGMMSISAIIVALIYVLFRNTALETHFAAIGFWAGLGTFITGLCIYVFYRPYRKDFNSFCQNTNYKALAVQFGNEILDAGGAYMTNIAGTLGPSVMIVTAFNATQPIAVGIIGVLLSYFGLATISQSKMKRTEAILLTVGILLIAVGIVIVALNSQL